MLAIGTMQIQAQELLGRQDACLPSLLTSSLPCNCGRMEVVDVGSYGKHILIGLASKLGCDLLPSRVSELWGAGTEPEGPALAISKD